MTVAVPHNCNPYITCVHRAAVIFCLPIDQVCCCIAITCLIDVCGFCTLKCSWCVSTQYYNTVDQSVLFYTASETRISSSTLPILWVMMECLAIASACQIAPVFPAWFTSLSAKKSVLKNLLPCCNLGIREILSSRLHYSVLLHGAEIGPYKLGCPMSGISKYATHQNCAPYLTETWYCFHQYESKRNRLIFLTFWRNRVARIWR